jgi:hypothetical protein
MLDPNEMNADPQPCPSPIPISTHGCHAFTWDRSIGTECIIRILFSDLCKAFENFAALDYSLSFAEFVGESGDVW